MKKRDNPPPRGFSPKALPILFACLCGAALLAIQEEESWPIHRLDNGTLQVDWYLPDSEKGFYRGPRFDWSSMVRQVHYQGHTFFAPFREGAHKPEKDDHASGFGEEFSMQNPPGYADAAPGEVFLKIGVGSQKRKNEKDYFFRRSYPILNGPRRWEIDAQTDHIQFTQEVIGSPGLAYRFEKEVRLERNRLIITRTLHNLGKDSLSTNWYAHHFFCIDNDPIGAHYQLELPFNGHSDKHLRERDRRFASLTDNLLSFKGEPIGSLSAKLESFEAKPAHHAFRLSNKRTGASVSLQCSEPPSAWAIYAEKTALCPEPFIQLEIAPGESHRWSSIYVFETQN